MKKGRSELCLQNVSPRINYSVLLMLLLLEGSLWDHVGVWIVIFSFVVYLPFQLQRYPHVFLMLLLLDFPKECPSLFCVLYPSRFVFLLVSLFPFVFLRFSYIVYVLLLVCGTTQHGMVC